MVSWFSLRLLLVAIGLFTVFIGDPVVSVGSEEYNLSLEKGNRGHQSIQQGDLMQARQMFVESLSCLGRSLPVSFTDQLFSLLWQFFRQFTHFIFVGFWLDRLMAQRTRLVL